MALLLAAALVVPNFANDAWTAMLVFVALYVALGLGLNVVVGFAGLLDLGYVAFFATGAYSLALLTSPASPLDVQLHFWAAAPIGLVLALVVGVLLGLPVLPLRGDYLAIVTSVRRDHPPLPRQPARSHQRLWRRQCHRRPLLLRLGRR
jgi:branched-chain amino acid transport system permease protein